MAFGYYELMQDEKGRIQLPQDLLPLFENGGYICRSTRGCSLQFFAQAAWKQVEAFLASLSFADPRAQDVALALGVGQKTRGHDANGRLTIPQFLREDAALGKALVVVATGDTVFIWDKSQWDAYRKSALTTAATAETLDTLMRETRGQAHADAA
jgi:MraZ protein